MNSDSRAALWSQSSITSWTEAYRAVQREILDSDNGAVKILFLFESQWYEHNRAKADQLLVLHDDVFRGTKNPVETRALVYSDSKDNEKDITIMNSSELFMWYTHPGRNPVRGGRYTTRQEVVGRSLDDFEDAWRRALEPMQFRQRSSSGPPPAETKLGVTMIDE